MFLSIANPWHLLPSPDEDTALAPSPLQGGGEGWGAGEEESALEAALHVDPDETFCFPCRMKGAHSFVP